MQISPDCYHVQAEQTHRSFPRELLPKQSPPSLLLHGIIPSQILHTFLLNFMRFLFAHFSSLSWSLWVAILPFSILVTLPDLVSPTGLLSKQSVLPLGLLMKTLNSMGSSVPLWGMLLVTGGQLGFAPLMTRVCSITFPEIEVRLISHELVTWILLLPLLKRDEDLLQRLMLCSSIS